MPPLDISASKFAALKSEYDDLAAAPGEFDPKDMMARARASSAGRAAKARKASGRAPVRKADGRMFVDPATCDPDYSPAELEFLAAMQAYKKATGRMFPTWSEALDVLKGLGYRKGGD